MTIESADITNNRIAHLGGNLNHRLNHQAPTVAFLSVFGLSTALCAQNPLLAMGVITGDLIFAGLLLKDTYLYKRETGRLPQRIANLTRR